MQYEAAERQRMSEKGRHKESYRGREIQRETPRSRRDQPVERPQQASEHHHNQPTLAKPPPSHTAPAHPHPLPAPHAPAHSLSHRPHPQPRSAPRPTTTPTLRARVHARVSLASHPIRSPRHALVLTSTRCPSLASRQSIPTTAHYATPTRPHPSTQRRDPTRHTSSSDTERATTNDRRATWQRDGDLQPHTDVHETARCNMKRQSDRE